jgi:hypothetical protein
MLGSIALVLALGSAGDAWVTGVADGYVASRTRVTLCLSDCGRPAVSLVPIAKPRPARETVLNIRANLIGPHDSKGRVMFAPFWASLPRDEQLDWEAIWRAQGCTHLPLAVAYSYPGSPIPGGDYRGRPTEFAALVSQVLDDGFVPIVFLSSGDAGTAAEIQTSWPALLQALAQESPYIWEVPGFEVVGPGGAWRSRQLSDALLAIHLGNPAAALGVHLQPERATGSSSPIEPDDPWHGDHAGFWTSNGGEFVTALLYETPHGRKLLDPNGAGINIGGWEDRWIEVLDRLGVGGRGWPKVPISFFEVSGYDYYRGLATDADQARLARRAKALADQRGVVVTFGNGLPR